MPGSKKQLRASPKIVHDHAEIASTFSLKRRPRSLKCAAVKRRPRFVRNQYQHSLSPETDSYDSWFDDICKVRVERVKRFKAGNEDVADHRLLRSLRVLGLESGKDLAVLFHAMLIELIA